MDWGYKRIHKEPLAQTLCRSVLFVFSVGLFSMFVFPMLHYLGAQLHSALTGTYVPGHHSVLLINCPNEQVAKDIGRAIMDRRMAASVNVLPKASTMYYWKGEIHESTEILMLVKTRTSKIQRLTDYVKSIHPYDIPEVLSFPVEDGILSFMKWMDEAVPAD
ncbi:hypothetical protein UPYG_G00278930 [Umbra pygmaea]|uniref:Protein CutA homolog n=1 Tax=Umbra pygmaea TaxID=75934 RepID=A0ABD0W749_UMBPY